MKKERKWKIRRVIVFISCALFLILSGFIVTLHILIPKKIQQQLQALSPVFRINYSSIHTNLFASAITLNDLNIVFTHDSTKKEFSELHFSKARITDINFLKFASKNLSVNKVELDDADISLDSLLLEKKDSVLKQMKLNLPFKKISISNLQLPRTKVYVL